MKDFCDIERRESMSAEYDLLQADTAHIFDAFRSAFGSDFPVEVC
jgi:hypothetical protein